MRSGLLFALAVALLIGVIAVGGALFTVSQTEQAVVLRFGEPVAGRGLITEPGLHFKFPLVENVVTFDNRILDVESPNLEVLAADNQRLEVDSFIRYRIVDALRFYQTVNSVMGANNQLGSVLNSAVRRVLSEANQQQIVRDERAGLMVKIKEQADREARKFGVQVVDARIRRVDLPQQISEKVFGRMQTERQREAAEYRAQGSEQAQKITAKADRDVVVLKAEAQQKADQMKGEGDAERNRIFAEAFGRDPDFFAFYRSMQAYESAFKPGETRFLISPRSEFFRFFSAPEASAAPSAEQSEPERNLKK
ncbi:protease modulator HflC [Methylocystis sp. L43]|jgi:membrane protease subunit HflC|uniref:protease modulator HflC n=1 Tax=unclassified Methylocystis TaxID=2625913 RepID=UPI0018C248A9|nr:MULTISPECIES: protease modulator HflC [unclassified Methylocystis]MBG0796634.1 protease modulator HflC [Methylocystis sp. L43]MBG0804647.1 protease modulator HflC [Methylocystis sp. H15]